MSVELATYATHDQVFRFRRARHSADQDSRRRRRSSAYIRASCPATMANAEPASSDADVIATPPPATSRANTYRSGTVTKLASADRLRTAPSLEPKRRIHPSRKT